jgi:hypothetical protein
MPDPFISQQDLSDYLGRDVTADAGALAVVDAACDVCRDVAEQSFNRVIGGTVTLDGSGTDALLLPELPVSRAGTVLVNGTAVTDYTLNGNGILLRGSAGSDPRPVWPSGRQNVTVTYDHGYADADIPRSVRMVALSLAARLIVQGVAKSETIGETSISYAVAASDLTNGELRILRKHRPTR